MTAALQQETFALLARIRPHTPAATVESTDFDWSRPNAFTREALTRLGGLGTKLADDLSEVLREVLRNNAVLEAVPLVQHYGRELASLVQDRPGYGVRLVADGKGCGFLYLSAAAASGWVAGLLGAGAAPSQDRELSNLEATLLLDIVTAMVQKAAVSAPGLKGLKPDGGILRSPAADGDAARQEYCEFGFIATAGSPPAVALIVQSSAVASVVAPPAPRRAPEDVRKDLLKHIERVNVRGEVWLGQGQVPVRDLIALEEGDVLLLNRLVGESVHLVVQGKTVAAGTPAQSDGFYAVQIVQRS